MAEIPENELIVVGGGPGGYAAAFLAADKGMRVTLINEDEKPGGCCLHVGCIPSKALLHTARVITEARDAASIGLQFAEPKIELDAVRGHTRKVIDTLAGGLVELCRRRNVEYVRARAKFIDGQTLELSDGQKRRFKHCVLAVGSSPFRPPALQIDSPRLMDSTGALRLEEVPKTLLVVGGGYIGLELGTVYAALGSQVTVVELTDGLLPGVDRDLVRPLQNRLSKLLHRILLNTKVLKLEDTGSGIRATLEGAEVEDKTPVFDRVLTAVGRKPNSANIGLESAGIEVDGRGFVKVDAQRRSSNDRVYAIGDIAGEPMLAHKASHEGKIAVEALHGEPAAYDFRAVPAVVFTDPEIAWCGMSETDAKKAGREVRTVRFPWAVSGRALTLGRTEGLTKLVIDTDTDTILGVGIVGVGAGELIGEGVVAVEMAASARDLTLSMHPHPTMTETIGEAAEMLYGASTHIYKPRREKQQPAGAAS